MYIEVQNKDFFSNSSLRNYQFYQQAMILMQVLQCFPKQLIAEYLNMVGDERVIAVRAKTH